MFHVINKTVEFPIYYEKVHRTPTFKNHFFNWLPIWVIGLALTSMAARPGTPYWRADVLWTIWAIWSGLFAFLLLIEWSKVIIIGVYRDCLAIWTPGIGVNFHRSKIIRYELHDTLSDHLSQYGWPAPYRLFAVHRHYAKGIRFYIRQGEETAVFVESRHPKELLAALDQMMSSPSDAPNQKEVEPSTTQPLA